MNDGLVSVDLFSISCIAASVVALSITLSVIIYRIVRPHFPVTVNCWFCNKDSKVPYGNKSCWDCPSCEQYNGFSEDGDYNKSIPAQYKEDLNHPACIENRLSSSYVSQGSVLCEACNRNQLLKMRQLANFVPYNEANYDMEVEGYKFHLEQIYRLCRPCQIKVDQVIEKQNEKLQGDLNISNQLPTPDSSLSMHENSVCSSHLSCRLSAPWHVKLLRFSSLICAISIFLTAVVSLLEHSHSIIEPSQWLPMAVMVYCSALHKGVSLVLLLGLISGLLAIYRFGKHSLHICDAVSCLTWLFTLAVYSNTVIKKLKTEDRFLLQAICATSNMVVCLWGSFCPRFEKGTLTRVRKKRRRRHLNLSSSSISGGSPISDSDQSGISSNRKAQRVSTSQVHSKSDSKSKEVHVEKFETMSLGTPSRGGMQSAGIFTVNNGSQSSPSVPLKTPHQPSLLSLQKRKPLISPARFKPKIQNNAGGSSRKLFASSSSTKWKPGLFPSASQSQDQDDRESLFSEARSNQQNFSDSDEDDGCDSRSSFCPVGSSGYKDDDVVCEVKEQPKRSLCTRLFLGVSLGLNIALVLYFTVDFDNFPNSLNDLKNNISNISDTIYDISGPLKEKLILFGKELYSQGVNVLISLTQDIPGEQTAENITDT